MEYRIQQILEELKSLMIGNHHKTWMNIKEVCTFTNVSESTIRRAVKNGGLKASHATGKLLFKVSDVDKWLED